MISKKVASSKPSHLIFVDPSACTPRGCTLRIMNELENAKIKGANSKPLCLIPALTEWGSGEEEELLFAGKSLLTLVARYPVK